MTFLMHRKPVVLVDNRRSVLKPSEPDYCGVLADRLKVKCDGERPCTRCQKLEKQCVFFEIPKDPVSEYDLVLHRYQPRLTSPQADRRRGV
ncbi:unnamed protein product [Penicillium nalgiovense]|nr:unnamed protein product [Penicillium nalgiovense]